MTSFNYAFTITLKPVSFKLEPEQQYDKTYLHVRSQLISLGFKVTLVAELTKNMNVHYHGVINFKLGDDCKIKVIKEFHKQFRNDLIIGFVNIRQIDDDQKWNEYIKKSLHDTNKAIGRRPIISDDFKIFSDFQHATYALQW